MTAKRKKIKNKKIFGFVFIILLLCAGIISFCLFTPFFNVKEIAVSGNEAIDDSELADSSGIVFGTNIFKVNTRSVKKNILKNPLVDNIEVKRKIPARIDLIIEETAPQLITPYLTGYVVIDEKAKVLELRDEIPELLLPMVSGIEVKEAKICERLVAEDDVSFEIMMENIEIFHELDAIKYFRSMDFTNLSNFSAVTHEGVKVIFGKLEELEYKIKFMKSVMPNIDKSEGTYIDISSASKGIYGTLDEPSPEESVEPGGEEENAEKKPQGNNIR